MLLKVTFLKNLTSLSKVQPIPYAFYDQNDWHFNFNFIYHFLNISSIRYLFIAIVICYYVVHNAQQEIQLLSKYFFNIVAVVYLMCFFYIMFHLYMCCHDNRIICFIWHNCIIYLDVLLILFDIICFHPKIMKSWTEDI